MFSAGRYTLDDFVNSAKTKDFNWLYYSQNKIQFFIKQAEFTKECSKLMNDTLELNEILDFLGLSSIKTHTRTTINSEKVYGFYLSHDQLANNVFNISYEVDITEDIENNETLEPELVLPN